MGILSIVVHKFTPLTRIPSKLSIATVKYIALTASIINLFISIILFILFDFSTNQFQFVQEYHNISYFDFYLGIDGLSIYFVLLTTIIIPISLLSNWKSMDLEYYFIIILLLESLLLLVFLVLDILLFYIFFESILPPLFLLIGLFGSDNRIKASFYLFLYTLLGSLFLLLSILGMSSIMSATDFDSLFKKNFLYLTQVFLFYGIFIAFAVKTPTIFLNTWLLKAHVESPLGGSIILAAIVLKLSLYGILRLILPVLPKAFMAYTYIVFLIGVITIVYASISTLRTIDVKELIAYSSVSHAAVYLIGLFSNSLQGIEGGITLGLAHGFISPGLFIVAGGVLYDRYHTRLISFYKGMTQLLPLLSVIFFILCLGNCGAPLTLNFVGEFMSLYGVFERSSFFGVFASSSIVFSAAYTIYMYQRISFGGQFTLTTKKDELVVKTEDTLHVKIDDKSKEKTDDIVKPDINQRENIVLLPLVVYPAVLGICAVPILDPIHFSASNLLYMFDLDTIGLFAPTFVLRSNGSGSGTVNGTGSGTVNGSGSGSGNGSGSGSGNGSGSGTVNGSGPGTADLTQDERRLYLEIETSVRDSVRADWPQAPDNVITRITQDRFIVSTGRNIPESWRVFWGSINLRNNSNNSLPFVIIGPILELFLLDLPLLATIITSLAGMVDGIFSGLVFIIHILFQGYRIYKLPSRIIKLINLSIKIYNFISNYKNCIFSLIIIFITSLMFYLPDLFVLSYVGLSGTVGFFAPTLVLGSGRASGSGTVNGSGSGTVNGTGSGTVNGSGSGSGNGSGSGSGTANGSGTGSGSGTANGSVTGSNYITGSPYNSGYDVPRPQAENSWTPNSIWPGPMGPNTPFDQVVERYVLLVRRKVNGLPISDGDTRWAKGHDWVARTHEYQTAGIFYTVDWDINYPRSSILPVFPLSIIELPLVLSYLQPLLAIMSLLFNVCILVLLFIINFELLDINFVLPYNITLNDLIFIWLTINMIRIPFKIKGVVKSIILSYKVREYDVLIMSTYLTLITILLFLFDITGDSIMC